MRFRGHHGTISGYGQRPFPGYIQTEVPPCSKTRNMQCARMDDIVEKGCQALSRAGLAAQRRASCKGAKRLPQLSEQEGGKKLSPGDPPDGAPPLLVMSVLTEGHGVFLHHPPLPGGVSFSALPRPHKTNMLNPSSELTPGGAD